MTRWVGAMAGLIIVAAATLSAQTPAVPAPQQQQPATGPTQSAPAGSAFETLRPNYVLGPGDQILIRAFEAEEISEKPFRIDGDGYLNLPLLGRIKAGGLTVENLERQLAAALRKYVQQPQVTVTVIQFRSEPVFFVGAFKSPGIYPLQGQRTLVEMLSQIGGLSPNASRRIKVTRRKEFGRIPLPTAVDSPDGKTTAVLIGLGSLRENVNPAEDIVLQPFDVVSVERAEMIFVNGEVGRVGGFELNERDSMSVVQVLSLAGGLGHDADPKQARVLRPILNSSKRAEIPINISRIMKGQDTDFPLMPNDLLFVPRGSSFKRNLGRGLLIAVPLAASLSIALALR